MEAVFAQARDAEVSAEELLVDDDWKAVESLPRTGYGVEPETIAVNGNGTNGHRADSIGPSVELVVSSNGHLNGNGSHGDADEGHQSLFSWAEFMAEEPAKPRSRSRKPSPASTSLFEWAFSLEQERETEPVGAVR